MLVHLEFQNIRDIIIYNPQPQIDMSSKKPWPQKNRLPTVPLTTKEPSVLFVHLFPAAWTGESVRRGEVTAGHPEGGRRAQRGSRAWITFTAGPACQAGALRHLLPFFTRVLPNLIWHEGKGGGEWRPRCCFAPSWGQAFIRPLMYAFTCWCHRLL